MFWDSLVANGSDSGEASWTQELGWTGKALGSLSSSVALDGIDIDPPGSGIEALDAGIQSLDGPLDFWNGFVKDLVWDETGTARIALVDDASPEIRVAQPAGGAWDTEASDFSPSSSSNATQLKLLYDGFRTVFMWIAQDPTDDRSDTSVISTIYSINSEENNYWALMPDRVEDDDDDFHALNPFSNGMTRVFDAATDLQGTVLAVYISKHSDELTVSCSTLAKNCQYRLYASVQGPDGLWAGPMPLDDLYRSTKTTTTFAQESDETFSSGSDLDYSATEPGLEFATPRVAYLGDGRFLVVAVISDYTTTTAPVTKIFSRTYTVGSGWDTSSDTIEIDEFDHVENDSESFSTYRPVNEIQLASNGSGGALLLAQITDPDSDANQGEAAERTWVHATYHYVDGSGWTAQETFENEVPCPAVAQQDATDTATDYITGCGFAKMEAAYFANGEAVVVFPMPMSSATNPVILGLYGAELTDSLLEESE